MLVGLFIEVSMVPYFWWKQNVVSNSVDSFISTKMGAPNIIFPNKASIVALRQEILSIIINILDFDNTGDCFLVFDNAGDWFLDFCTAVNCFGASWMDGSRKENGEGTQAPKTHCPCFVVVTHGNDIAIMETDADSRWIVDDQVWHQWST